jgi:dUTP pyrophosphatase
MKIKLKRLSKRAKVPTYGTKSAGALDLYAVEDVTFHTDDVKAVRSGWIFEIPEGYYVEIMPRSGLSIKNEFIMFNSPGVVDSDYRGEVYVYFKFIKKDRVFSIERGERFAQMILKKKIDVEFEEVEELNKTDRGVGGFGSTGA